MSVELLLFLALFIGVPLIQTLIRASRKDVLTPKAGAPKAPPRPVMRAGRPPARAQAPPPLPRPATVARPKRPVQMAKARAGVPAAPPVPAPRLPQRPSPMTHRALQPAIEEVLAVARRVAQPVGRTAPHRRVRPAGLGTPTDLRRSIVLMTILGPPRATTPHDWPPRAEG